MKRNSRPQHSATGAGAKCSGTQITHPAPGGYTGRHPCLSTLHLPPIPKFVVSGRTSGKMELDSLSKPDQNLSGLDASVHQPIDCHHDGNGGKKVFQKFHCCEQTILSQNGSAILAVNVCTHNPCKCKHSKF